MESLLQKGWIQAGAILQCVVLVVLITCNAALAQTSIPASIQYVSPLPGSSNNSQQTNIILRLEYSFTRNAVPDPSLVNVEGSVSGQHSGRVIIADDGRTLLFNPEHPFVPHEKVTVAVAPSLFDRGGTSTESWKFEFTTSPLTPQAQKMVLQNILQTDPAGELPPAPDLRYVSSLSDTNSNLVVPDDLPKPNVLATNNPSDGGIFFASWKVGIGFNSLTYIPNVKNYLMIVDNSGKALAFKHVGRTTDFKPLANGTLSYFDYTTTQYYILNQNFVAIDSFSCGNGYQTDPHDIRLLKNGHVVLIGLDPQEVNMHDLVTGGDSAATVIGIVVQEIDQQKNVVFQWRSFDHFLITDATHENLTASTIDYVHPNALDVDYDGNILLSSRHMDEITKIDRSTGNILWRWGGKNNQFVFVNDSIGFSHQHDIDLTSTGTYTVFDNGNFHTPPFSRALEYSLDQVHKTATLVWQFRHNPDTYTFATGSVQRLPNGNTFIGWGANYLSATEVRPDGSTAFELQYGDSLMSYRAFRFPWPLIATSVAAAPAVPFRYELKQNYPNPFNPSTTIEYTVPQQAFVTVKIFDMLGREVATLVNKQQETGTYSATWDASSVSTGVYLYKLAAGNFVQTRKMILLK